MNSTAVSIYKTGKMKTPQQNSQLRRQLTESELTVLCVVQQFTKVYPSSHTSPGHVRLQRRFSVIWKWGARGDVVCCLVAELFRRKDGCRHDAVGLPRRGRTLAPADRSAPPGTAHLVPVFPENSPHCSIMSRTATHCLTMF